METFGRLCILQKDYGSFQMAIKASGGLLKLLKDYGSF